MGRGRRGRRGRRQVRPTEGFVCGCNVAHLVPGIGGGGGRETAAGGEFVSRHDTMLVHRDRSEAARWGDDGVCVCVRVWVNTCCRALLLVRGSGQGKGAKKLRISLIPRAPALIGARQNSVPLGNMDCQLKTSTLFSYSSPRRTARAHMRSSTAVA